MDDDFVAELVELGVEGADLVGSFNGALNTCCWVTGMNSQGQAVVSGLRPEPGVLGSQPLVGTALYLLDWRC